jgi:xanthine/CO dehydrogenase XdhC/CoxF family maturation factor
MRYVVNPKAEPILEIFRLRRAHPDWSVEQIAAAIPAFADRATVNVFVDVFESQEIGVTEYVAIMLGEHKLDDPAIREILKRSAP